MTLSLNERLDALTLALYGAAEDLIASSEDPSATRRRLHHRIGAVLAHIDSPFAHCH